LLPYTTHFRSAVTDLNLVGYRRQRSNVQRSARQTLNVKSQGMGDRIKRKPALDLKQSLLARLRFKGVVSLNAPGIVGKLFNSAPRPVAKLSERSCAQGERAGFEAFHCGDSASLGDLLDNL